MRTLIMTSLTALIAGGAFADDLALVIGNEDYDNGRDISDAGEMLDAVAKLRDAGFTVIEAENATATGLREVVGAFADQADGSGRIVIAVAGHVVMSEDGAWVLGTDADEPGVVSVAEQGFAVDELLEIASRSPGQAVVLFGTEDRKFDLGEGLERGVSLRGVPQGVTVIYGDAGEVADFAKDEILVPGRSLAVALQPTDLTSAGFVAPLVPFIMADGAVAEDENSEENAYWAATEQIGTREAYQNYLDKYPDGAFVDAGLTAIAEINALPGRVAEETETALGLTRDGRAEIQRSLSLVGFDPKGIDGIFGPGSRGAITAWQTANGAEATGYVTQSMRERLALQAERRSAELEEEARIKKLELERADRAFWERTGAAGDEAGLRTYLAQYPDGVFAEVALERLKPFDAANRERAAGQDRLDWDAAEQADTLDSYRSYIASQPEGAFTDQARARVAELEAEAKNKDAYAAAERNEQRLGMNDGTRRLVEQRLAALDLKPGEPDGVFDEQTRRAIRRYQEARKLQVTGYLNQATAVRLLADSILR